MSMVSAGLLINQVPSSPHFSKSVSSVMSQAVRINVVRFPGDKGKVCALCEQWRACIRSPPFETIIKQVVLLGSSLQETLEITSGKFGAEIVELLSLKGAIIDDVRVLRYAKPLTRSLAWSYWRVYRTLPSRLLYLNTEIGTQSLQ